MATEFPRFSRAMASHDMHNPEVWEQFAPQCQYRTRTLAARAGISVTQLKRCSGEVFHATPQKLLNQWRHEDSLWLLEEDDSIKDTAEILGYEQRWYFSRDFREYSGISPGKYKSLSTEDRDYLKMAPTSHRRCRILLQILARKNEHINFRYKMDLLDTKMVLPGTSGQLQPGWSRKHHFGHRKGWYLGDRKFRKELLPQMKQQAREHHYGEDRASWRWSMRSGWLGRGSRSWVGRKRIWRRLAESRWRCDSERKRPPPSNGLLSGCKWAVGRT
jgi:AraC-like DNA-binding protein